MGRNATEIERAVGRSLRDSLEKLQRNAEEVSHTIGDLVSACSSANPANTLPHMLRAQTAAASLAATLDVLSRFITSAMQPGWGEQSSEAETATEAAHSAPTTYPSSAVDYGAPAAALTAPVAAVPEFSPAPEIEPEPAAIEETLRTVAADSTTFGQFIAAEPLPVIAMDAPAEEATQASAPDAPEVLPQSYREPAPETIPQSAPQVEMQPAPQPAMERGIFDVASLPADQQELHRRANRVAKVSMQDIKMLRPADVTAGKENHDLCVRLRDDIERAHKEYERRFHAILNHPVDYFYAWMVEILGEGDARALGEYPYPSAVARR
jgi:hypothetical protein